MEKAIYSLRKSGKGIKAFLLLDGLEEVQRKHTFYFFDSIMKDFLFIKERFPNLVIKSNGNDLELLGSPIGDTTEKEKSEFKDKYFIDRN